MPVSVKKLLADLIEMYRIYGEIIYVLNQREIHPIYILHFNSLYENRILEPLDDAEELRFRLPAHFEQIKYDCQEFNICFQSEIYNNIANLFEAANFTFRGVSKVAIIREMPQAIKLFGQDLKRIKDSLVKYADFFGEESKNTCYKTIEAIHIQLGKVTNMELPSVTTNLIAKFLPENLNIDIKDALKFINNKAVIAIVIRLIQYEPWTTLTNPDVIQKFFGNINGPNDERFKKTFSSPAAMQSINALRFTKEQEQLLFVDNKEFIKGLYRIYKISNLDHFRFRRTLININNGDSPLSQIFTTKYTSEHK